MKQDNTGLSTRLRILADNGFPLDAASAGYLKMVDLLKKISLVHQNLDKIKPNEFVGMSKMLFKESHKLIVELQEKIPI